ncbi:MAG TPA: hypothetical protein VHO25_17740, partial [Polyangiaceae bacterium]|nr:hypothetical protein [Polyangiaceae bacterium]
LPLLVPFRIVADGTTGGTTHPRRVETTLAHGVLSIFDHAHRPPRALPVGFNVSPLRGEKSY